MHQLFRKLAERTASAVGSAWAFGLALLTLVVWGLLGPAHHYSDSWQLVVNTGTTIVTFLMVFLIQNTQNREARAMRLKLDELLRAVRGARNSLVELDELTDEQLETLEREFRAIREHASGQKEGVAEAIRGKLRARQSQPAAPKKP